MRNANIEHLDKLTKLERMGAFVNNKVGTMGFFLAIAIWTTLWLGWNLIMPDKYQFDPAPAFQFWLFISNLIQICIMPLIMVGQNIQAKHAELRAEIDLATNIKAEHEVRKVLSIVEDIQHRIKYLPNK